MGIITNNPTAYDAASWIIALWEPLQHWRHTLCEEGDEEDDKDWDEVCTVMAWLTEELGYEYNSDGDLCLIPEEPDDEPDPELEQKIRALMPLVRRVHDEGSI